MFGGTLGFNAQYGSFVFGLEGDAAGNWMRDSNSSGTGICAAPGCAIQTSWFATARGRIGYAFDRALFYVTAGGAFGDVQMITNGLNCHGGPLRMDCWRGPRICISRPMVGEGRISLCRSRQCHLRRQPRAASTPRSPSKPALCGWESITVSGSERRRALSWPVLGPAHKVGRPISGTASALGEKRTSSGAHSSGFQFHRGLFRGFGDRL